MRTPANEKWCDTGVDVAAGDTLAFTAEGRWIDWFKECGPEGFPAWWMRPAEGLRRVPKAPWLALCGALDKDLKTAFLIGPSLTRTFPSPGRLYVFANDVAGFYFNNKGAVEVDIRRV